MEENDLIKEACEWFEKKYNHPPQELGMMWIKIWHKISPFCTIKCVVFAATKQDADRFTFVQNIIFATLSYFWVLIPLFVTAFICAIIYQNILPLIALGSLCLILVVFYIILAITGTKWERQYIDRIAVYYP